MYEMMQLFYFTLLKWPDILSLLKSKGISTIMNVGIIKYNYNNDILEQICQKLRSYCYLEEHFAIILYKNLTTFLTFFLQVFRFFQAYNARYIKFLS